MIDTWPEQKHSDGHVQVSTAFADEIENSTRGLTHNNRLEDSTDLGGKKNTPKKPRKRDTKAKQSNFDDLVEATYDPQMEAASKLRDYKWETINLPPITNEEQLHQHANKIAQYKAYVAAWKEVNKLPENPTLELLQFQYDIFKETDEMQKLESTVQFINQYAKHDRMVFDQLSNFKYCRLPELDEIEDMFAPQKGLFEDT